MKQVAQKALVSVATVSHVINGTRYVEPETVARVQQAIEALGYYPNSVARSLRRGKTHIIGLLVPDNSNPFFAEIARVVENEGFKHGYSVILCNSDGSENKEEIYANVLLSQQIDGLILIASGDRIKAVKSLLAAKMPLVVVDRELPGLSVTQIMVDHWRGGYLAGQYLAELGHRHIAYIAGPNRTTPSAQRLQGFQQALQEAGITLDERLIVAGDFRFAGGQKGISDLLRKQLPFTAVFAANDLTAMGAISALHAAGLQVPDDISVIGFDDIPYAVTTLPPITTISQPIEEIGALCVRALLERMEDYETPTQQFIVQPQLVVRKSCTRIN